MITPNRPADFENPFHVSLFEADELESLLRLFFDDVDRARPRGLTRAARRLRPAARQRREAAASSTRSTCATRCRDSWYVWGYERVLPVVYRALGSSRTGIGSGLDESHFFLTDQITPTTPGLFAVARQPAPLSRRPAVYLAQRPRESGRSVFSSGSGSRAVGDLLDLGRRAS